MTDIKIARDSSFLLTEIHNDVFLITRHRGAIETSAIHAFEILNIEFAQRSSGYKGKTFFTFRAPSFNEGTAVFKSCEHLIGCVNIEWMGQMLSRAPRSVRVFL